MDDAAQRLLAAAEASGVEIDEAEAARWIDAVSDEAHGGSVSIDVNTGVYGHRITMADLDGAGLDRFRRMAAIVGFEDRPPYVLTALALSGSAAQARIHRFPADADFFERIHILADTREAACGVLALLVALGWRRYRRMLAEIESARREMRRDVESIRDLLHRHHLNN